MLWRVSIAAHRRMPGAEVATTWCRQSGSLGESRFHLGRWRG
jgi:hypothetical protein